MLLFVLSGALTVAGLVWIVVGVLPLGSLRFLAAVALAAAGYGAAVWAVRRVRPSAVTIGIFVILTLVMRAPFTLTDVGTGSDMLRYAWDARLQRAGVSPYGVTPSDPAVAHLHTPESRGMNNVNITSPYPPGAQIFFRLATIADDSAKAIKFALMACDLAVIVLLVVWLRSSGRNPLLAIAYAWNPLVVLEIAHSGHLDAAGMLMTVVAAFALARRWLAISVVALAAGIAIKFLPLVLVPLWWGRARVRHALLGGGVLAALYVMFIDFNTGTLPVGSVTNMVQGFRFNGPVFKAIAFVTAPWLAAAVGVGAGLACAAWMRRSRLADDPAAFAWPMAAALVCSPVVYPWYLLWFTPFFISPARTWPLMIWTVTILPVYVVWQGLFTGGIWAVPIWMGLIEYGLLAGMTYLLVSAGKRG